MLFISFAAHVRLFTDFVSQPSCQHIASISNISHSQFNGVNCCRTSDGRYDFLIGQRSHRQSSPGVVEQFNWCHINTTPAGSESGLPSQNTSTYSRQSGEKFHIPNFGPWIDVRSAGAIARIAGKSRFIFPFVRSQGKCGRNAQIN